MPRVAAIAVLVAGIAGGVVAYQQLTAPDGTDNKLAQASPSAVVGANASPTASTDDQLSAEDAQHDSQPGLGGGLPAPTDSDPTMTAASSATSTSSVVLPGDAVNQVTTTEGDTLLKIADRFDVSVTSLIWSNEVEDPGAPLEVGTVINVPHQDGVVHEVQEGETLTEIAAMYSVEEQAILDAPGNDLDPNIAPEVGSLLLVPGGVVTDRGELATYTIREGDTLIAIAGYYGLQPQTIVWANELPHPDLIHAGQELIIPPGDGALITAEEGDTVEEIAGKFNIDPQVVRDYGFNNLDDQVLQVGQQILVPGDFLPPINESAPPTAEGVAGEGVTGPATGQFIWPTEGFISQEYHTGHTGVDIANEEWTPVNAADGGIVIFSGWSDLGLGYAVGIDHGNGYQTWYGHLASEPYVEVGQVIWQGGYLGPMGTTGKSTGPHLHFVVIKDGAYQNPLDYLQQ